MYRERWCRYICMSVRMRVTIGVVMGVLVSLYSKDRVVTYSDAIDR